MSSSYCGTGIWTNAPKPGDPDNNSVLTATPAFGGIDVAWTYPEINPTAVAYVDIFRGTSDNPDHATRITRVNSDFYFDKLDTTTLYFYWIQITSIHGTVHPKIGPASARAMPAIGEVIKNLTDEINESHLGQHLKERISRIQQIELDLLAEVGERIASDDALASFIDGLQMSINTLSEYLISESEARVSAIQDFVDELNALQSLLYAEVGEVENRFSAVIERIDTETDRLRSEADRIEGRINSIKQFTEDEIARLDQEADRIDQRVDAVTSDLIAAESRTASEISRVEGVVADTQQHLADEVTRIEGDVDAVQDALGAEAQRLDERVDAVSSSIQTTRSELESEDAALLARLIEAEQTIVDESEVRHTEDQFQAERVQGLVRVTNDHSAHIGTLQRLRDDADLLEAIQFEALTVETANRQASIRTHEQVRVTEEYALAQRAESIEAAIGDNAAAITLEQTTRADLASAMASQIGELSAKLDAQPTFGSGFEPGTDFDQWVVAGTDTLTVETSDVYLGTQTGLLTSTATKPSSSNSTGVTHAAIPSGATEAFEGYEIVVRLAAKQPSTNASAEFAVAYSTASVGNSSWQRFVPGDSWEVFEFRYEVPEGGSDTTDYIGIWADTSGGGGGVLLDAIRVQRANAEITEITAAITAEQQARVDAVNALTSDLSAMRTSVGENKAAITAEETARTSAVEAEAQRINALNTRVGEAESSITSMETAYTAADAALASRASTMETRIGENKTAITQEKTARTNAVSSMATDIAALKTSTGDNKAAILEEKNTRTDELSAASTRIDALVTAVGDADGGIIKELSVLSQADGALASDISGLQTSVGENETAITNIQSAWTTAVDAVSSDVSLLQTTVEEFEASFLEERLVRSYETGSLAQGLERLQASTGENESGITSLERVTAESDLMEAVQFEAMGVESAGRSAAIRTQQQIVDDGESISATRFSEIEGSVGDAEGAIRDIENLDLSENSALITRFSEIEGDVSDTSGRIRSVEDMDLTANTAFVSSWNELAGKVGDSEASITAIENLTLDENSQLISRFEAAEGRIGETEGSITALETLDLTANTAFVTKWTELTGKVGDSEAEITDIKNLDIDEDSQLITRFTAIEGDLKDTSGRIKSVEDMDLTADTAFVTSWNELSGKVGDSEASITDIENLTLDENSQLISRFEAAEGRIGNTEGSIQALETMDLSAETAFVTEWGLLEGRVTSTEEGVSQAEGAIEEIKNLEIDADSALVERFTNIEGSVEDAEGRILEESSVRARENSIIVQELESHQASQGDANTDILSLTRSTIESDLMEALQFEALGVEAAGRRAAIRTQQQVTDDGDTISATRLEQMEVESADIRSDLTDIKTMSIEKDANGNEYALSTWFEEISTKAEDSESAILSLKNLEVGTDGKRYALLNTLESLESEVGDVEGSITAIKNMELDPNQNGGYALLTTLNNMKSRVGTAEGKINDIQDLVVGEDSVFAKDIRAVETNIGNMVGISSSSLTAEVVKAVNNITANAEAIDLVGTETNNAIAGVGTRISTSLTAEMGLENGSFGNGSTHGWSNVNAIEVVMADPSIGGITGSAPSPYFAEADGDSTTVSEFCEVRSNYPYAFEMSWARRTNASGRLYVVIQEKSRENGGLTNSTTVANIPDVSSHRASRWRIEGPNRVEFDPSTRYVRVVVYYKGTGNVGFTNLSLQKINGSAQATASLLEEIHTAIEDPETGLKNVTSTLKNSYDSYVDSNDGVVSANSTAIEALETTVNDPKTGLVKVLSGVSTKVNSIAEDIDNGLYAEASSVTDVQANLGDLITAVRQEMTASSSGDLLVFNGAFSTGYDLDGKLYGWHQYNNITLRQKDPDGAVFEASVPSDTFAQVIGDGSTKHTVSEPMPVNGGERYSFKLAWGRWSTGQGKMRYWLQQYDANGSIFINGPTLYEVNDISTMSRGKWHTSEPVTITLDTNTVKARVVVTFEGTGGFGFTNVTGHRADITLGAMYSVKVGTDDLVGGFGIHNDGHQIDAGFDVDKLWVGSSKNNKVKPFIIEGGLTYIDEAVINKLTFDKLRAADGSVIVEDGKLKAGYIEAEELVVRKGQSTNYSPGSSGWRLTPTGGEINFPISFNSVSGAGALASRDNVTLAHVTDAGTLAGKDSLKITEILNAGALASKNTVDYETEVTNKQIIKLGTNPYHNNDKADAYSAEHKKTAQLLFTCSTSGGWPTTGGCVTYWQYSNRARQVAYNNGNGVEWVRETNPGIYPDWTAWTKKEIFSSSDVQILQTAGAGKLAAKDNLDISEVLNAGALASKSTINYNSDVTNKPVIDIRRISRNAYTGDKLPNTYSSDHKVGQLIFELAGASGWPEGHGGVVTYWYATDRATQVCYGNDNDKEFVRYTRPNIYPQWTEWKQKEVFSSADVKILETSGAGKLAAKDSLDISEVLNAGALASKSKIDYNKDVNNAPEIAIVRAGTNAYSVNDKGDAYSKAHKKGQLIFDLGNSDWPENHGGVVTYWYGDTRATQICFGNGGDREHVRDLRPANYPNWSDWVKREVFSSADVKILDTNGAGALAAKDSLAINEVLNAGALASKDKVDYDNDVNNRPIIKLGTNAYNASDKADAYSNEHKAGQLLFTCSGDWPTVGGVVTYWTHKERASQVCYSTGNGLEWVRRTNPGIYPEWTGWVKKEVFSSSDVNALQTINGPAQAGADVTGSNTAKDTVSVWGTPSYAISSQANNRIFDPGFTETALNSGNFWQGSGGASVRNRGDYGPCGVFDSSNDQYQNLIAQGANGGQQKIGAKGGQTIGVSFSAYVGPYRTGTKDAVFFPRVMFFDSSGQGLGYKDIHFNASNSKQVYSSSNPDGQIRMNTLWDYYGTAVAPNNTAFVGLRLYVRNLRVFVTHLDFDLTSASRTWVRPNSTLIDGNKIYTGDAYVDTLQIKGNAVTVPVSAQNLDRSSVISKPEKVWHDWGVNANPGNLRGGKALVSARATLEWKVTLGAGVALDLHLWMRVVDSHGDVVHQERMTRSSSGTGSWPYYFRSSTEGVFEMMGEFHTSGAITKSGNFKLQWRYDFSKRGDGGYSIYLTKAGGYMAVFGGKR